MRLCEVRGKKAIFHAWSQKSYVISPSPFVGGDSGGQVSYHVAIVELECGSVNLVQVADITFCDTKSVMKDLELRESEVTP